MGILWTSVCFLCFEGMRNSPWFLPKTGHFLIPCVRNVAGLLLITELAMNCNTPTRVALLSSLYESVAELQTLLCPKQAALIAD